MTKLACVALPVPPVGTALNGSGEAYVASLEILVAAPDRPRDGVVTDGTTLELLLIALGMRRRGFDPRSFAFQPFEEEGPRFARRIESHWSSIESSGAEVVDLGDRLVALGKRCATIAFSQTN